MLGNVALKQRLCLKASLCRDSVTWVLPVWAPPQSDLQSFQLLNRWYNKKVWRFDVQLFGFPSCC